MFARLLLLFTVVPLVELFLLIEVGRVIGPWPTVAIVIGTGVIGAWLARIQGFLVLRRVQEDLQAGRPPADGLVDGLLILVAGAVLLTPGMLTDALGFVLLAPPGRRWIRKLVVTAFSRHFRLIDPNVIDPNVIDTTWYREDS